MDYSVLMSVYHKEKPEFLKQSMESIFQQTVPTNDFVLVCDGPLTVELDKVIAAFEEKHSDILNVVRLEENQGLGKALQIGIHKCKNNLVARMDSDDISRLYRCERELTIFAENPDISIVGSIIEEFSTTPDDVESRRVVPEYNDAIKDFSKTRNPFNHPSVMYKKADVLKAGNYSNVRYMQDYYLWVDMLIAGMKGYNIQEALVWMRADSNLFKRRSGMLYLKIQVELFKKMRDAGFITSFQYWKSSFIRVGSSLAPNWMRKFMFKHILRK